LQKKNHAGGEQQNQVKQKSLFYSAFINEVCKTTDYQRTYNKYKMEKYREGLINAMHVVTCTNISSTTLLRPSLHAYIAVSIHLRVHQLHAFNEIRYMQLCI
jgi:hypothetical protein